VRARCRGADELVSLAGSGICAGIIFACAFAADGTVNDGIAIAAGFQAATAAMNWDQIQADWNQFKGRAKQRWGKLSNQDLEALEGRREVLAGKIIEAYAISKQEVERQLEEWQQGLVEKQAPAASVTTDRAGAAAPRH
jgi:uncharacterized protein YjbJ (UPF0337 family)